MVHISQFYPCSRIDTAIELYYISELGKYLKYNYGETLSLNGVIIPQEVRISKFFDYFRLAYDEGWVADTGLDKYVMEINLQQPLVESQETILNALFVEDSVQFDSAEHQKRVTDMEWGYRTPKKSTVSFAKKSDEFWLWNISGADGKRYSENKASVVAKHADMAILSLCAMVAVERQMHQSPKYFYIAFSQEHCATSMALSLFDALCEHSSCFSGWVSYAYDDIVDEPTKNNLTYQAWYAVGVEKGLLCRWYTQKEKLEYMRKLGMTIGDVVCLYERKQAQRNNAIKSISNCQMAIIRRVSSSGIDFTLINTVKPYAQGKHDFDKNTMAVKALYGNKLPYAELNTTNKSLAWSDLGIEYMMHNELYFITPIVGEDFQLRYIDNGQVIKMSAQNLIYWILKDYDADFNEEHFLVTYFSNDKPYYTLFHEGSELPSDAYDFELVEEG